MISLAVVGCALTLWPRGELPRAAGVGQADSTRLVSATLTKVARLDCPEADPGVPGSVCVKVTAQLTGGRQVTFDTTDPTGGMFRPGQRVRLAVNEQPGQPPYYNIQDLERGRPLLVLAALFMGAVVAFGRWQGVRALCGSVGLIAAVPLTTVLAALVATEEPQQGPAQPVAAAGPIPEAESAPPADAEAAVPHGRSGWGLARGLSREVAALAWDRARTNGLVRLDLTDPEELDLLRGYGPFTTDAKVWVHGDATPVIETGDSMADQPRYTYHLDPAELERLRALLAEAGLASSSLVPRRLRATKA